MAGLKIGIAGGGIGGLAAGVALARRGHAVTVREQADAIREVGAGLQITPNGMAVLGSLGLAPAIEEVSIRAERVRLVDGPSGRDVLVLDLARHAPDLVWRFIHRARLIDVLVNALRNEGGEVLTGQGVVPPADGAALPAEDLLVGADGLKSSFRARIDEASKPFFTGQVAWRAIVPDDEDEREATVWMGPGRHLVSYPLKDGLRNIVAVEARHGWADEGWSHEDHPANVRAAFAGFAARPRSWLDRIETCHLWGLFRHRVAHRWSSGRQVLLGDAAHPTLPFLAQGANLALEDAFVVADCLEVADMREALARYEALRRPRAARVVAAAEANARNYHLSFPPIRAAAHGALRIVGLTAPALALRRFDWLYRHDVTRH